ncbi:hypothetical protein WR25_17691 [Diploscapter pachys]|uniref:Protein kinase domain-containing protein n=1 Tax=Diploscapter pachys TaxID=2018661 RepID=A0A2A2KMY5_9BILA|nr:hypothetical protein WR25_17691 [Diploscapter pachys]
MKEEMNCINLEKMTTFKQNGTEAMSNEMSIELKNLPAARVECIEIGRKLATGNFGDVHEGVASSLPVIGDRETKITVKKLHPNHTAQEKMNFLKEAILMNNFDHPSIVKLLGVCLNTIPELLITEYMDCGDLLTFLRSSVPTDSTASEVSLRDLLSIIIDVNRGAAYLEMNKHVHRNIAAKNCLISKQSNNLITKLGDFGFAKGAYSNDMGVVCGVNSPLLRHLSPETLTNGQFTPKSDVWSFGVLLYETLSLGQIPYDKLENRQIAEHVKSGGIPSKPPYCPDQIHKIMLECWKAAAESRPSFSVLLEQFESLRENSEFQDDKPFPSYFGFYDNEAFGTSQAYC